MAANNYQGNSSSWGYSAVATSLWKGAKMALFSEEKPTPYEDHKELIIVSRLFLSW